MRELKRTTYRRRSILGSMLSVFTIVCALLTFISVSPGTAHAASGDIGFHVSAQIPENQIDKQLTYFDLRMTPGAKQTLTVNLISDSAGPVTVDISAISASTNRNGIIDYRTPGIKDKTLKVPFSEISRVKNGTVTIPAGGTAAANVDVAMPAGSYDGVALGGIVITKKANVGGAAQDVEAGSMGAAIKNEYSYIIGVKLSETNAAVAPDFEYDKVEVGLVNYQPAVIHYIRNKEAAIVKGMNLSAKVYKGSEKTPYIDFEKTVDMAPNSVMPIGTETGGRELDPGDYVSRIRLVASDKIWEFEKRFSVTSEEAKDIKDNSVATAETIEEPAEADLPLWLIAAIIGGALLALAAFILLLILLLKRRKDDKDNNEDSTKGSDKI